MAARAGQAVELIFHDIRHDHGQIGHLMTQGIRVAAGQRLATAATGRGFARDGLPHLVWRNEEAKVLGMTRLGTAFLAWLSCGRWRWAFAVKAIRGRGQGRIGGIGSQFGEGVGQLYLELLDLFLLLLDLFLLLVEQNLSIVEFDLEFAVGNLQFGDAFLGFGLFQLDDTPTQDAEVKQHVLRYLLQGFFIHHANGNHVSFYTAQPQQGCVGP